MAELKISDLLSRKRNLEHILDSLKEGIIAHDLERRIFFFNREAEKITGYAREEVLGRDCHDVFGSPFCGERCSFCGDKPALKDRKEYSIHLVTKGGDTRQIEMSVTLMQDDADSPCGVIASFRDLTDFVACKLRAGELNQFSNIIGRDNKMLQVFEQIRDVADYDYPVHIFGETGTGKELVAAAIHNESRRGGAPFVPINCGALPEGLIESELFGHVKGAFSGAIRDKKGRFELADRGTIFLDEVSELSKYMQVKLLRFLQESTFERVGGEETLSVNSRVISATNKDLKKEIQRGNFREDLYYRLNVVPLRLPPLRDRKNDIPLLVEHFLARDFERHGKKPFRISGEALAILMDYSWPGNVRELQNAIQYAIVKCRGKIIAMEHLPMEILEFRSPLSKRGPTRKLDLEHVKSALKDAGGNKSKAAKLLGVGRATLYRFISETPELDGPEP